MDTGIQEDRRVDPDRADAVLARCQQLIDPVVGVIGTPIPLIFRPEFAGEMYGFTAPIGRLHELHPAGVSTQTGPLSGNGTSVFEPVARVRAVCEALERYCSVMFPLDPVVASAAELGDAAVHPQRWPQCSDAERRRAPASVRLQIPDPDREDLWVEAYSLTRDRFAMVPVTAVYLGIPLPLSRHVVLPTSSGCAAGTCYADAVLAGLLELIERDSLMLWWLHQLPLPRLRPERLEGRSAGLVSELIDRASACGVRTELFDVTSDLGAPVAGVLQRTATRPRNVLLGASRLSLTSAAVRALEEASSLRVVLGWQEGFDAQELLAGEACSPEAFGALYADAPDSDAFRFALEAPESRRPTPQLNAADPLSSLVARLADHGMEVLAVDLTLPEVRECGIVVVRVLVPELQPISFAHSVRYLASSRLYDAVMAMGFGERTESGVTTRPIPYA